jgi:DNA-binding cell septation regulator SpoVG
MAAKKSANKETKEFKEFKHTGTTFEYTGRVYPAKEGKGKVKNTYYLSITLNGVLTINGCYLVETENNCFIKWPQYKSGDDYKSYIFTDKEFNKELDGVVFAIMAALGIE